MPFPTGTPVVTLTGTIPAAVGGNGASGTLVLTPSAELIDGTRHAVYPGGGRVDFTGGTFTVQLIPNKAAGIQPAGWKWHVDLQPEGGRRITFWADIEGDDGATITFDTLVPIPAPGGGPVTGGGTGGSSTPTGPAGGALSGTYPNPSLSTATVARFDAAGAASTAQSAAAADATSKVSAHAGAADPHGDRAYADGKLSKTANLSDLGNVNTARTNLGLGAAALLNVGTTTGTVAAGDDSRLTNSRTPTGAASGDLAGTYPGPSVAKVAGVAITGTPTNGQVLTASSGTAATWQTPAAGSGGSTIKTASVRITDDNLSGLPAAASWTVVQTSAGTKLQCSIAAAAGDRIKVYGNFMHIGSHFFDWSLLDGAGAIALYATTGTATAPTEGNPTMYTSNSFLPVSSADMFTVASGHINAGLITVALAHQGAGTGTGNIVYAHPTYPWRLRLENIGAEPA